MSSYTVESDDELQRVTTDLNDFFSYLLRSESMLFCYYVVYTIRRDMKMCDLRGRVLRFRSESVVYATK